MWIGVKEDHSSRNSQRWWWEGGYDYRRTYKDDGEKVVIQFEWLPFDSMMIWIGVVRRRLFNSNGCRLTHRDDGGQKYNHCLNRKQFKSPFFLSFESTNECRKHPRPKVQQTNLHWRCYYNFTVSGMNTGSYKIRGWMGNTRLLRLHKLYYIYVLQFGIEMCLLMRDTVSLQNWICASVPVAHILYKME
jgi:hypothetical protein